MNWSRKIRDVSDPMIPSCSPVIRSTRIFWTSRAAARPIVLLSVVMRPWDSGLGPWLSGLVAGGPLPEATFNAILKVL